MTTRPIGGAKPPTSGPLLSADGIFTTQFAPPPIQVSRWARNAARPNAVLENTKAEAANFGAMFRTKEVFRSPGFNPGGSLGAGDVNRWRFAFHTGPYARNLAIVARLAPPSTANTNAAIRLDLLDGSGVSSSSDKLYYGVGSTSTTYRLSLDAIHTASTVMTVQPDTDYTAQVVDVDNGITQSICVYELASLTEFFSGYLPQNFAVGTPIVDAMRANLGNLTAALWRRGGAQLLNFSTEVDSGVIQTTGAAWLNAFDQTSTTPGPATGGYYLDLSAKARRSQQASGVPVRMHAYVLNNGVAPATGGSVALVNQAGVAQLSIQSAATTGTWVSTTGLLPATLDKYDLMYRADGNGSTMNLYAVSVYEYEP